jgi:asparagine synthase (glutamine-hydrolysing)
MSVQFGMCNFDGRSVHSEDLDRLRPVLAPYGPDREGRFCKDNLGILYRSFFTTTESRREVQPYVSRSWTVVTWDGRLDNRQELIGQLEGELSHAPTDVEIVTAAYERWGTGCFAKLIGDWALSVWNPHDHTLILAKDFLGARHLYYSIENEEVTWCTILDPLLLLAGRTFAVDEEYVAGWLSFFPAPHLTPYVGVRSVPPSCFVRVAKGTCGTCKYWEFDAAKRIRYGTDAEYEEHFRSVFGESVRRRLRSDSPILAELSGGMDSSSIVCMADEIISRGQAETSRLDTLSYYDDSEPNWNERPYFSQIEAKRGRLGCHIDVSSQTWNLIPETGSFEATPGCIAGRTKVAVEFSACLISQGSRAVLSGIGGDEVTGGVPTPAQELADLLSRCSIGTLAHKLKVWALVQRRPWFHLLAETIRMFLPPDLVGLPEKKRPPTWLDSDFINRHRAAMRGYETRLTLCGALPSFQDNVATLNALRRQLGCDHPSAEPLYEARYPFLDRDLLEFLYAVPREQLVRPGQRRSLMRRSLSGIVPDALLNRRRKAYVARAPLASLSRQATELAQLGGQMVSTSFGIVDAKGFSDVIQRARDGQMVLMVTLMRTLQLESWLRALIKQGLIDQASPSPVATMSGDAAQAPSFSTLNRNSAS